ncbi:MAG TPA: translocation/assembly module TamB domain-containing protein, partial [Anaeromyxobacteraceae bacterium]|nr:translocation/assembly module TamB domain-containing protein [Anaeromyxobacteraceae bacterium]
SGPAARRALDARLRLVAVDLALLPRALLPPRLGLAGQVDAEVSAKGATAAPAVTARLALARGAVLGMEGLTARAELAYDGARRRARLDVGARRAAGGEVVAKGELPVALARAGPREPLALHLVVRDFPLTEALRLAQVEPPEAMAGTLGLEATLGGVAGAPTVDVSVALDRASYGPIDAVAVRLALQGSGREARLTGTADARAARAAEVEAALPLDWARLLRAPAGVARGLATAPLTAKVAVPGYDLALVAGRLGIPSDLRGQLAAGATVTGTARAPRGDVAVDWTRGAVAGYQDLQVHLAATATGSTRLEGRATLQGEEVLRLAVSAALPVERLGEPAAREAAALTARLDVPRADLSRSGAPVPLAGHLEGWIELAGSLASPRLAADVKGRKVEIGGVPLGDVAVNAHGGGGALHAGLELAGARGGTLTGALDAEADLGLPALRRGELGKAPSRAALQAHALDLGFLPSVAPGLVRSASGKLEADLTAAGPLARLVPRGTATVKDGSAAVVEFGEWTGIALEASLSDDVFQLDRLTARHGHGRVEIKAKAIGLARKGAPADLTGSLEADDLTVSRAGQDFANVTASASLSGKLSASGVDAELQIPHALVKLPPKLPTRKIQPLDQRPDIVVAPFHRKEPPKLASAPATPFQIKVHLLVPNRFQIKGDNPTVDVELKADVVAEEEEGDLLVTGTVETLRGRVESIGGHPFDVKRGRIQFTGDVVTAGLLDVQAVATYSNPSVTVTVAITGSVEKPELKLTSEPAMDEGQLALLVATGRSDFKAGAGGISVEQVGGAAFGALTQQAFKDLLADKLPLDSVTLDSSQLRAGKYLTDKIYVGYTRRGLFGSTVDEGKNTNEVRVEYQISRRWTFETSYGDAQSGGASLIWSKDY